MFVPRTSQTFASRIAASLAVALFWLGAASLPTLAQSQTLTQPVQVAQQRDGQQFAKQPQQQTAPDANAQQQGAPRGTPRQQGAALRQETVQQPPALRRGPARRALVGTGREQIQTATAPSDGMPDGGPAPQDTPIAVPLVKRTPESKTVVFRPADGHRDRTAYVRQPWGWVPPYGQHHGYRAQAQKPHYGHHGHHVHRSHGRSHSHNYRGHYSYRSY